MKRALRKEYLIFIGLKTLEGRILSWKSAIIYRNVGIPLYMNHSKKVRYLTSLVVLISKSMFNFPIFNVCTFVLLLDFSIQFIFLTYFEH